MGTDSKTLFDNAKSVIPGGVNSPVRAFKSVGGTPVFINRAKGAYLWDESERAISTTSGHGAR